METKPEPLGFEEAAALEFYIRNFERLQYHASVTGLRAAMNWSWSKASDTHRDLHAKGYIGSLDVAHLVRGGAPTVTSIKRDASGLRVKWGFRLKGGEE